MNIKKISAAVMAAAVLAVGAPVMGMTNPLGVVASAAEAKLVTGTLDAELSEKLANYGYVNLGKGYFIFETTKTVTVPDFVGTYEQTINVVDKIVHIGDDEIAKWRSTGKLEPAAVQCDVDLSGLEFVSGGLSYIDHIVFYNYDNKTYNVFKIDEAAGKFTKVYDFAGEKDYWNGALMCGNGYCVSYIMDGGAYLITAIHTSTGEKLALPSEEEMKLSYRGSIYGSNGKYFCFVFSWGSFNVYGFCPDGSIETVAQGSINGSTYNFINVKNVNGEKNTIITADGKTYELGVVSGNVESVNGTTAVISTGYQINKLVDLTNNGKELSKAYLYMVTYDNGKTYLVQSEDGKWGYLDSKGKEIAIFDDAGSFTGNGLYAPVVKDGKGWLVDKNMNQVSEKIDATGCITYGEELFSFTTADGNVWVTSPETGKDTSAVKPGNSGSGTALSDKTAGVSVNGDFPSGTKLNVTKTKKDDNTYTVDITPVDANGNKVQPNDAAVVMVLIPELNGKSVNVYRVTDGNYTKLNSWTEGDSVFFTTSHFSEFEITTEKREEANPNTGSEGIVGLAAVALISTGVLVVSRKKR